MCMQPELFFNLYPFPFPTKQCWEVQKGVNNMTPINIENGEMGVNSITTIVATGINDGFGEENK